ncbi:MAG: VOC family protein [Sphingomonas bacterium]|nr:VOC family protein [Sphingomonas bacterium]
MAVRRIVTNVATDRLDEAKDFYVDVLGMTIAMDHGWIGTLTGSGSAIPQISFAEEGGSGTPVPELSIEVDDPNLVHARAMTAGAVVEYGPVSEPWGVRRFYLRDLFGRLLRLRTH